MREYGKMKKLNLGCGNKKRKGWINLDSASECYPDVLHDLNQYPYPFYDNEIDEVYADNVLEHLENNLMPLEEIWRICKKGAKITILVPLAPSPFAFQDPTHKQFFGFSTFDYFAKENSLNYYSKARFKIISKKLMFYRIMRIIEPLVNVNERTQKFFYLFLNQFWPSYMLKIVLEVEK